MSLTLPLCALLALALTGLLAGCGGFGGGILPFSRVTGTVRQAAPTSPDPITVSIEGTDLSTTVAPDGTCQLDNVPPGTHTLIVRNGQSTSTAIVHVQENQQADTGELILREAGNP